MAAGPLCPRMFRVFVVSLMFFFVCSFCLSRRGRVKVLRIDSPSSVSSPPSDARSGQAIISEKADTKCGAFFLFSKGSDTLEATVLF